MFCIPCFAKGPVVMRPRRQFHRPPDGSRHASGTHHGAEAGGLRLNLRAAAAEGEAAQVLAALQAAMTAGVAHLAGLNPEAFRRAAPQGFCLSPSTRALIS